MARVELSAGALAGLGAERPLDRLTLAEIQRLVDDLPEDGLPRLIALLEEDSRQGARRCLERARRRWHRARVQRRRFYDRFALERRLWSRGYRLVAGVDEVGRGPLAGPVVAAAVVLPADAWIPRLDDSKRLDAATRRQVAEEIRGTALGIGIGEASVAEINRLNIFHAAQLAMRRAIAALPEVPHYLIVDGLRLGGIRIPQIAVPGGDRKSNSVAAASVVAKVHRDALMDRLDRRYPEYGFGRHKGYPTPEHRRALALYGPCPEHRAFAGIPAQEGG